MLAILATDTSSTINDYVGIIVGVLALGTLLVTLGKLIGQVGRIADSLDKALETQGTHSTQLVEHKTRLDGHDREIGRLNDKADSGTFGPLGRHK